MTIKELISILKEYPGDMGVVLSLADSHAGYVSPRITKLPIRYRYDKPVDKLVIS